MNWKPILFHYYSILWTEELTIYIVYFILWTEKLYIILLLMYIMNWKTILTYYYSILWYNGHCALNEITYHVSELPEWVVG